MWQRYNQTTKIFEKSVNNGVSWTPLGLHGSIITEGGLNLVAPDVRINMMDSNSAPNLNRFSIVNSAQRFRVWPENDSGGQLNNGLELDRSGNLFVASTITERGRAVPMGNWQDVPFNAANFSALAPMTWTVGAAAIVRNRYAIIGKTCIWSMYISWFSGSNVLGGTATNQIKINCPVPPNGTQMQILSYTAVAGCPALAGSYADFAGIGNINISKFDSSNFVVGTFPGFIFTIMYEAS